MGRIRPASSTLQTVNHNSQNEGRSPTGQSARPGLQKDPSRYSRIRREILLRNEERKLDRGAQPDLARGLLFDFDGTLYGDWRIWISIIEETLADFQVEVSPHDALERARSIIEKSDPSAGTLKISNVAAVLAKDHGIDKDDMIRARFFERLDKRMDETGPEEHIAKMLKEFKREGFHLGIVTFVRKPRITRRLDIWKFSDYFESVMTPDDEPDFKPSPRPYIRAMEELQVKPHECFVVGDEPVDMMGGKKAKATAIGIPQGFFTRQELERAGADYILNSLNQLPRIVG